jgi:hypothetical protein
MRKIYIIIFAVLATSNFAQSQNTDFKPSGNLWGYVFGDFYWKQHSDSLGRAPIGSPYGTASLNPKNPTQKNMNAFQIRRAYLGYDYMISPKFSAQVVLAHEMNVDGNGYNVTYLKYAWLKWTNIFPMSNLMIGQMPTSSFATPFGTEPLWGYRSVEKTIIDLHSLDPSTDLGVMLIGNLWKQKNAADSLPSTLGYNFMIANGTGAKPETDRYKKIRGNVYVNTLHQKLTLGVYADFNPAQYAPYPTSATTLKGYVHYKSDGFRIGAEVFQITNRNGDIFQTTNVAPADTANGVQFGWSIFGSTRIIKGKLNLFARLDQYNPDTKFSSSNYKYTASAFGGNFTTTTFFTQTFYLVGLDYTPTSRIHIMANLWYTQYKTLMNNDIAGNALGKRAKSDYDLVPRITFLYTFNSSKTVGNNGMDN